MVRRRRLNETPATIRGRLIVGLGQTRRERTAVFLAGIQLLRIDVAGKLSPSFPDEELRRGG